MRHRVKSRTLGRQTGHRQAMLRNLATSLLEHKRIETTVTRAREVSAFVEGLIEHAKKAQQVKGENPHAALHHKRQVFSQIYARRDPDDPKKAMRDRTVARQLFDHVATRYLEEPGREERKGGYTRVTHLGVRHGDGAPLVLLELV